MYQHLWNINRNAHPKFYTKSPNAVDNKPPCHKETDSQEEGEEEEEECPLPVLDPPGTHLRIPESEHNLEEQSSESMSNRLERHLGTIIEEMFQERTTLEL